MVWFARVFDVCHCGFPAASRTPEGVKLVEMPEIGEIEETGERSQREREREGT